MSTAVAQKQSTMPDLSALQKALFCGDIASLSPEQKIQYYNRVCELVGLNPLTKPFDFIKFQGKEVMYANKGCAEQLRQIHQISVRVVAREKIDDIYVVTSEAADGQGRVDSSTGAVALAGLKGEALANAMMKAETKSKRRVTLSICGLNMLDDTEVDTIPGAQRSEFADQTPPAIEPPKTQAPAANLPKPKTESSRVALGKEINAAKKTLQLTNADLADMVQETFNKGLDALTEPEMAKLRDMLLHEIGRNGYHESA